MTVVGIVLAAGAGTRFGGPKALARTADGEPWVARAVDTLVDAGCATILVAVGAAREQVAPLVPGGALIVEVPGWRDGLASSIRAALIAAERSTHSAVTHSAETHSAEAALIIPVDVPELPASACRRLLGYAAPQALARAVYEGVPGHPVIIGRAHWASAAATVTGDRGAGGYLEAHGALGVECGDLWHGRDVDT